ncbi:MAG TPA: permease-like cell division protein FtsX [Patescibacteria group bacterium]|nr:permease-like cell division protein FtsX [Patescibacteria group bacterium]
MNTLNIFRILKHGTLNFRRNILLSLASTLVMVITLIILTVIFISFSLINNALGQIKDKVDVSVYFKLDQPENRVLGVKDDISRIDGVTDITYVSSQQALENFKEKNVQDPDLIASIDELDQNPLPATLQIKAQKLDEYPRIVENIRNSSNMKYIEKINYEDNQAAIDRLTKILRVITIVGVTIGLVFAIASMLVIFNTIALTIFNRKEEVEIMRLVGATNWYIRGPFLVESAMYSALATLVAATLFWPVYTKFLPQVLTFTVSGAADYTVLRFPANSFPMLAVSMLALSFLLSGITTLFAMNRYLKR